MIIKSRNRLPIMATDSLQTYPLLPLMTGILFPGMMFTIQVSRKANLELLEECSKSGRQLIAAYCHSDVETPDMPPIYQVGVVAVVKSMQEAAGGSQTVLLEGLKRAAIKEITATEPYFMAKAAALETPRAVSMSIKDKMSQVISIVSEITQLDPVYSPE